MTKRNLNIKTEKQGVRYVQGVVENNHSIFQEFSRDNDQGNDCYIEFVKDGYATNYGVFVQIKSGTSYKDNSGYKIKTDQAHLKYWNNALNLIICIVYDPEINKAFWIDITSYLIKNPNLLQKRYHTIRLESANEFNEKSFHTFIDYCFNFREIFSNYENYGHSLEWFANISNPNICYEGLKSLYSNHREKASTWFYIISNFSKTNEEGIRANILGLLSNYVNNNIIWHKNNIEFLQSEYSVLNMHSLMTKYFRQSEVESTIPFMKDGIQKGSFSYLVFLVINMVEDIHIVLRDIAFKPNTTDDIRNFCFWLYLQTAKFHSIEDTLITANEYLEKFPKANEDEAIIGVKESIMAGNLWPVG